MFGDSPRPKSIAVTRAFHGSTRSGRASFIVSPAVSSGNYLPMFPNFRSLVNLYLYCQTISKKSACF